MSFSTPPFLTVPLCPLPQIPSTHVDLYSASHGYQPPLMRCHVTNGSSLNTQASAHSLRTYAWAATRLLARQRQSAVGLHLRNFTRNCRYLWWWHSVVVGTLASINVVSRHRVRLVLGWVTVCEQVNISVCNSHLGRLSLPSLCGR